MKRRLIAIGLAVILAGVATVSLMSYVGALERKTLEGVETVHAFVAKEDIAAGTAGEDAISSGLISRELIPRKVLAEGGIVTLEEIAGKVAAVNIHKGEQILGARFVGEARAKGTLPIPADRQAIAIDVQIPPGVAGFIQPGDRVSIIAKLEAAPPGGGAVDSRVQYYLQNIQVLAVGRRVVTPEGQEQEGSNQGQQTRMLLTLALTPDEAEKLVYAIFNGQVYFTLLPPDQAPVDTPGRTRSNAFS